MKSIHLLDSDTINKIAAGEVVERPSSVVKELVENAIDAKASAITIEIKEGGISFIRVTDNGSGIDRDDIETAFLRHATSKIETAMDLMTVGSLGFRGEALSSIASVAQVELITKVHRELLGVRYCADGGICKSCDDIGCPDGTTIIVRNLFYNTPARRKFLKTPVTEAGYISDLVGHLALSHPDISFKLIINDQNKLHTSGNANLKDIIYQIYGRDVTGQLMEVKADTELFQVSGYIGKPILSRGNRTWENYFINGRYIKSNIITKAIEDAYKTFVMIHKYPFTVLHFQIDPALIDVNVHPRKMELRFNQNEAVYQQTYDLVRSVLEHRELIPSVSLDSSRPKQDKAAKDDVPEPFELQRLASMGSNSRSSSSDRVREQGSYHYDRRDISEKNIISPVSSVETYGKTTSPVKKAGNGGKTTSPTDIQDTVVKMDRSRQEEQYQQPEDDVRPHKEPQKVKDVRQLELFGEGERLLDEKSRIRHRMIGQVFDTYWMIEYDGKLFIIDQHAAHEKVLYERLMKDFSKKTLQKQMLSPPVILTLSMQEENIYKQYADYFSELGFEVEAFGGREYAVCGVPLQLFGMDAKDIFIEILDSLSAETRRLDGTAITDHIATMACKAAVKGNNKLSFEEADALIEQLLQAKNPYTCPHGRPTIISISKYELEKKFKRIQ
ncbi:MAG: DNA mismatch repair endonuclease MutL [Coprococcus sp.]